MLKWFRRASTRDQDLGQCVDGLRAQWARRNLAPALALALVKEGDFLFRGSANAHETPPTPDTVFQVGSISKLFTAALFQILCDEGVVASDLTLGGALELPRSSPVRAITLRMLASHTSGFPRVPRRLLKQLEERTGKGKVLDNPYSHFGFDDVMDYLLAAEDLRAPGKFAYSNFGMGLLGHLLEKTAGQDLDGLARGKLFSPLGMDDSGIFLSGDQRARLAPGQDTKGRPAQIWTFSVLAGAGAFNSTTRDLIKFVRANFDPGSALWPSLRKLQEKPSAVPIGWIRPTLFDRWFGDGDCLWHDGMVGGYGSYMAINPARRTGVVMLANRATALNMPGMQLMRLAKNRNWPAARTDGRVSDLGSSCTS